MKKALEITVFVCSFFFNLAYAGIDIGFPNGGEKLPVNGKYHFFWTNSEPLLVSVYVDHYDQDTNLDCSTKLFSFSEFVCVAGPGAVNFPDLYGSVDLVTNGFYKLKLVGRSPEDLWCTNQSAGFFRITPPATIETVFNSTNSYWQRGEQKTLTVAWSGFDVGDTLEVSLLSLEQYLGDEYGFVYTNNTLCSESGTATIVLDYPTTNQAMHSLPPVDGIHGFVIKNPRTGIWYNYGTAGALDVVVSDLRVRIKSPNGRNYVFPEGAIRPLELEIDAQFAPTNVIISPLSLRLWSTTNILMEVNICDGNSNSLSVATVGNTVSGATTSVVEFSHSDRQISKGSTEILYLDCTIRSNANLGTFMWLGCNEGDVTATTPSGEPLTVGLINGFSSRISVLPQQGATIHSASVVVSDEGKEMAIVATCKINTRYSVEQSSDLRAWTIVKYLTTSTYELKTTVPMTGDKKFFRILERP